MGLARTVTKRERAQESIDHSLARKAGGKIMIRVLRVQEVIQLRVVSKSSY